MEIAFLSDTWTSEQLHEIDPRLHSLDPVVGLGQQGGGIALLP